MFRLLLPLPSATSIGLPSLVPVMPVFSFDVMVGLALPLFIAGLGWGIATAIVAAVVGAIATYALSYGFLALTYAVSCAVPCALLVRTALLSRPLDDANPDGPREWYPAGRLLLWTAAAGAAVTAAAKVFG